MRATTRRWALLAALQGALIGALFLWVLDVEPFRALVGTGIALVVLEIEARLGTAGE